VITVDGVTTSATNHDAYIGRVGVHVHQPDRGAGPHVAFTAGVGGGASTVAGRWISEDAGVILSGNGGWVVPFASLDGFLSQPIDAQRFSYTVPDDYGPASDILTNSAGVRVTFGLELRDGHGADSRVSFLAGLMMGGVAKADKSDMVGGLGAALRAVF
jgi:hypothetical protein